MRSVVAAPMKPRTRSGPVSGAMRLNSASTTVASRTSPYRCRRPARSPRRRMALIARSARRPGRATRRARASAPRRRPRSRRPSARTPAAAPRASPRGPARRPAGNSVPQWIGTTSRGRSRATARAAAAGSMCPGPSDGPHPQIGSSARSCRPASASMPGKTSVSPAKYTRCAPAISKPSVSATGPSGWRLPSCSASTAVTVAPATCDRLAHAELGHAGEPGAAQHGARAAGRDDPHAAAEHPQRRHVEVVEVQVRDEDGVEPRQHLRVRARAVADAGAPRAGAAPDR